MQNNSANINGNQPENKEIKADDFDKEKAAANQPESNTSNNNNTSTITPENDVLKEQKETD
jgi:hypothetical protein